MPAEWHHFKGITIKTKEGCLLLVTAELRAFSIYQLLNARDGQSSG